MSAARVQQDLSVFRKIVLTAVETLSAQHEHIGASMIQKFLEMRTGKVPSLSQIGNNLRVLKKRGILIDYRAHGHKYWKKTGRKYEAENDTIHRALIAFPVSMYRKISKYAKMANISRTSLVTNLVGAALASIEDMESSGELDISRFSSKHNEK